MKAYTHHELWEYIENLRSCARFVRSLDPSNNAAIAYDDAAKKLEDLIGQRDMSTNA